MSRFTSSACRFIETDVGCHGVLARLDPYFEILRDEWFAPLFPRARHARLYCAPDQHDTPRHFAATSDDGRRVIVAPEMAELPVAHWVGILAHELGHVSDMTTRRFGVSGRRLVEVSPSEWRRRGRDEVELTADAIASRVMRRRIGYSGPCVLQELGARRPRPIGLR